jgi:hypothetical protein
MGIVSEGGNVTPAKRLIMMGNRPRNELVYNPVTWDNWTSNGTVTKDATGIEVTAVNGSTIYIQINTAAKNSTKYGILYEVVSKTLDSYIYGSASITSSSFPADSVIGPNKAVITTRDAIVNNYLRISTSDACTTGTKIKFKDFRMFELPPGSQVEWDFENLTASQLNLKYPF